MLFFRFWLRYKVLQTPCCFKSVEFAFTASVRLSLGTLFFLSMTKTLNFLTKASSNSTYEPSTDH